MCLFCSKRCVREILRKFWPEVLNHLAMPKPLLVANAFQVPLKISKLANHSYTILGSVTVFIGQ
jgi:hypothetical protein